MATFLSVGSVTALYYSNRVMQLPLALFGMALSQVALPTCRRPSPEAPQEVKETLNFALRLTLFMILPARSGFSSSGIRSCRALFEYGRFSNEACFVTTWALAAFSLGLFAYAAVKILAAAFYAYQTTKIPVIARPPASRSMSHLMWPLWYPSSSFTPSSGMGGLFKWAGRRGLPGFRHVDYRLGNAAALYVLLRRKMGILGGRRILRTVLKSKSGAWNGLFCGRRP